MRKRRARDIIRSGMKDYRKGQNRTIVGLRNTAFFTVCQFYTPGAALRFEVQLRDIIETIRRELFDTNKEIDKMNFLQSPEAVKDGITSGMSRDLFFEKMWERQEFTK